MPKLTGTKAQRKADLRQRLTPDYICNKTSIFGNRPGEDKLDEATVKQIKFNFTLWFRSWVEDDLEEFLK